MIFLVESNEIRQMLGEEGVVVVVRGNAFPQNYEVGQTRYMISSFFDGECGRHGDDYIRAMHREIEAWDYLNKGLEGEPGVAIGIAPSEKIAPHEFARLQVTDVVAQALRGKGRPDVWLVAARAQPGIGKLVLDGAIAADNIRNARWAALNQDTRQSAFGGNGSVKRS